MPGSVLGALGSRATTLDLAVKWLGGGPSGGFGPDAMLMGAALDCRAVGLDPDELLPGAGATSASAEGGGFRQGGGSLDPDAMLLGALDFRAAGLDPDAMLPGARATSASAEGGGSLDPDAMLMGALDFRAVGLGPDAMLLGAGATSAVAESGGFRPGGGSGGQGGGFGSRRVARIQSISCDEVTKGSPPAGGGAP